jgi:hypothetical protein
MAVTTRIYQAESNSGSDFQASDSQHQRQLQVQSDDEAQYTAKEILTTSDGGLKELVEYPPPHFTSTPSSMEVHGSISSTKQSKRSWLARMLARTEKLKFLYAGAA